MNASSAKGNDPKNWDKLIALLDDKLQLGLLDRIRRVTSYHFEEGILYLEPGSEDDFKYLSKDSTSKQLELLAQSVLPVEKITLKKAP